MRILLTNDDSIHAEGLWTLAKSVCKLGEVLVVAPDREQSGVGGAVTLHAPIRVTEAMPHVQGISAWAVQGTPADSVILGLEKLANGPIDLVISGINQGANLGEDVLISGTVGGILQAHFRGIPAIAISVAALRDTHFEVAGLLAKLLAEQASRESLSLSKTAQLLGISPAYLSLLINGKRPWRENLQERYFGLINAFANVKGHSRKRKPILLSVNLPNLPIEEIKGIDITSMGKRSYADNVELGEDGKGNWYWIKRNRPDWQLTEGTDIYSVRNARISITPLSTDLTAADILGTLKPLSNTLTENLRLNKANPT